MSEMKNVLGLQWSFFFILHMIKTFYKSGLYIALYGVALDWSGISSLKFIIIEFHI